MTLEQPRLLFNVVNVFTRIDASYCYFRVVKSNHFSGLVLKFLPSDHSIYVEARLKCVVDVEENNAVSCIWTPELYRGLHTIPLDCPLEMSRKRNGLEINGVSLHEKSGYSASFSLATDKRLEEEKTLIDMQHLYSISVKSKVLRGIMEIAKPHGCDETTLSILSKYGFNSEHLFFRIENDGPGDFRTANTWSLSTQEQVDLSQEVIGVKFSGCYRFHLFEQSISYDSVDIILNLSPGLPLIVSTPLEDGQSFKFILAELVSDD